MRRTDKMSVLYLTRNLTLPQKKQTLENLKRQVKELELDIELIELEKAKYDDQGRLIKWS